MLFTHTQDIYGCKHIRGYGYYEMAKKPIQRKSIIYTKHARAKMIECNITSEEIEVIRDSGRIVKKTKGRVEIHLGKKGKSLVAIFEDHPNELWLITTWRE